MASARCIPDERSQLSNGALNVIAYGVMPLAPALWAYEIRKVVLMGLKRKRIIFKAAKDLMVFLQELKAQLIPSASCDAILELAHLHNLTDYDAAYLDLALRERQQIASLDKDLLAAAKSLGLPTFNPDNPPDLH